MKAAASSLFRRSNPSRLAPSSLHSSSSLSRTSTSFYTNSKFTFSSAQEAATQQATETPIYVIDEEDNTPKKTEIEYLCRGNFPLDTKGTIELPKIPRRTLVAEFLKHKKVEESVLHSHLLGQLHKFIDGVVNQDKDVVEKLAEPSFANKITKNFAALKDYDVQYEVPENIEDVIDSSYIIDQLFIKGLSADRTMNDTNLDYVMSDALEVDGLRSYIHKYNLGLQPFYFKKAFQKEMAALTVRNKESDKEDFYANDRKLQQGMHQQRKQMNDNEFRMILRVQVHIGQNEQGKSALGRFNINGVPIGHPVNFSEDYTGNHIAVFECQLKNPPVLSLIDHTYNEFVLAHRLNFAKWKLIDLDNYMRGNPYFSTWVTARQWETELHSLMGETQEKDIKSQNDYEKLRKEVLEFQKFNDAREPNSNASIQFINERKQEEIKRVAAEEKAKVEAEKEAAKNAKKAGKEAGKEKK